MRCRLFGRRMTLRSCRAAAVGAILSFAPVAPAADVLFEGDVSNNWAVTGNWQGDALPTIDDTAIISGPITATVQSDVGEVSNVFVNSDGTLEVVTGGALSTTVDVIVADGSAGNLAQSGGALNSAGYLVIGFGGGAATYELSGGTATYGTVGAGAAFLLGETSEATFEMSGGTLTQVDVDLSSPASVNSLGLGPSGNATLNLSGGDISLAGATFIGGDGGATAVVNQTGGSFKVRTRPVRIAGSGPGSNATYNISGGTLASGTGLSAGYGSFATGVLNVSETAEVLAGGALLLGVGDDVNPTHGEINQSGGTIVTGVLHNPDTNNIGADVLIGYGDESTAEYNMTGGTLSTPGFAIIGFWGSEDAVLNISGDDTVFQSGANGAFEVGGETLTDEANPVYGKPTFGRVVQDGGTVIVNGQLQLAAGAASTGIYDKNAGVLEVVELAFFSPRAGEFEPGVISTGHGTFNQNGGETTFLDTAILGDTGTTIYNQNGGTTTFAATALVGFSGVATVNIDGGTMKSEMTPSDDAEAFIVGINEGANGSAIHLNSTVVETTGRVRISDGDADDVSINVSGDGELRVGTDLFVGSFVDKTDGFTYANDNHGAFNQSGGVVSVAGVTAVGLEFAVEDDGESRSHGVYNLSGGVLDMTDVGIVGVGGNGEFNQTGGTVNAFAGLAVADADTSVGVYKLSGGALEVHRQFVAFGEGNGTFEFTGGRLSGAEVIAIPDFTQTGGVLSTGASTNFTVIQGNYGISGDGVLEIKVAGLTPVDEHDTFQVEGIATLGGTVGVVLESGFVPQIGDLFEILSATGGDLVGEFDGIDFPNNAFGVDGRLIYETNRVLLEIIEDTGGVLGDTDDDNDVDLDDLNNVRNNFGATGVGDTDGDNDVDLDDLNNVRNNFGTAGSPLENPDTSGVGGEIYTSDLDIVGKLQGVELARLDRTLFDFQRMSHAGVYGEKFSDGPAAVPEPSTWALGLLSGLASLVAFRRRRQ